MDGDVDISYVLGGSAQCAVTWAMSTSNSPVPLRTVYRFALSLSLGRKLLHQKAVPWLVVQVQLVCAPYPLGLTGFIDRSIPSSITTSPFSSLWELARMTSSTYQRLRV